MASRTDRKLVLSLLLSTASFIAIAVGMVLLPTSPSKVVPRVHLEPSRLDLGSLTAGSREEFRLKLWNDTGAAIHVIDLAKSCGCMGIQSDKMKLNPGEFAVISGELAVASVSTRVEVGITVSYSTEGGVRDVTGAIISAAVAPQKLANESRAEDLNGVVGEVTKPTARYETPPSADSVGQPAHHAPTDHPRLGAVPSKDK